MRRNTAIRTEPKPDSSNKNLKRPRPNSTSVSKDKRTPVGESDLDGNDIYDEESNDNVDDEYTEKPIKKQTAIRSAPKTPASEPSKKSRMVRKSLHDIE